MDWLLKNPQIQNIFSSLGSINGDAYVINDDALSILEDINCQLIYEDQTLRTFRRAIGFGQHVRTDIIPLLNNTKDPAILDAAIRILVNLTVPVECLFCVDIMYRSEVGRCTIFELNKLLITSKEAFSDAKSTKSILDRIKSILENDSKKLTQSQCDSINNCLLLLRNILHIPETILTGPHSSGGSSNNCGNGVITTSLQNVILWNLFIQSIDKLLIFLMSCGKRAHWGVTIVQLIALMYKDQHVSTLQKLLNNWFEASLSDSSEDNESNTTTPPNKGSGDSSPMLTSSDPTSDSSDNGGGCGNPDGSSNKSNTVEDRRQNSLNKDTEATLQEVSRKGYEYKNAFLRPSANNQSQQELHEEPEELLKNKQDEQIKDEEENQDKKKAQNDPNNSQENDENKPEHDTEVETQNVEKTSSNNKDSFVTPLAKKKNEKMKPHLPQISNKQQIQKSPHSGLLHIGTLGPQKREHPSSSSELSDCGYATQVENQETISTSSNEDDNPSNKKPVHQKPPSHQKCRNKLTNNSTGEVGRSVGGAVLTGQDKNDWRRKKLVKRSKSNLINMKGLVQHTPTDEDISKILKEFTVDFLLKGYGYLVHELYVQLLQDYKSPIDTSHFFWLVTYFLKFAAQLELDLELVNSVLNYDIVSYLTFEGVLLCEQLEFSSRQQDGDIEPYLRRMHLVVTAIREFLQAVETYKKITHLSSDDLEYLRKLEIQIGLTEDLRSLFLLLLRRFSPTLQSYQYLQDIVVTNHILLEFLDNVSKSDDKNLVNIQMIEHISQFATVDVMYHYGLLLEDFHENGEFVNDCIFTMMHHVSGDLEQICTLFQPVILKAFSRIWETEYEVCDAWSDLIEYVIHKFMNTPQKNNFALNRQSLTELIKEHNMENADCIWTQEEKDILYWYYVQSKKFEDCVGKIQKFFNDNGNRQKSRLSIIQQLLQQDIITLVAYDDLMKFEDIEYEKSIIKRKSSTVFSESGIGFDEKDSLTDLKNDSADGNSSINQKSTDDIQILRDLLIKDGKSNILIWVQKLLLEATYVRLMLNSGKNSSCQVTENKDDSDKIQVMEPVSYHCTVKRKSIPLVPWNTEQSLVMIHQPFILLLHKLGFHLPVDAGSVFARIPNFWTADLMFKTAQKLGPINKNLIKFDINLLGNFDGQTINENDEITKHEGTELYFIQSKHLNSIIRYTPDPVSMPISNVPNWLQLVMKSKYANDMAVNENRTDGDSTSASATAAAIATIQAQMSFVSTDTFAVSSTLKMKLLQAFGGMNFGGTTNLIGNGSTICGDSSQIKYSNDDIHDNSSGYQTRRSSNLESEYSAIIASVSENQFINNICETEAVSIDLTRMYVSDEDTTTFKH